MPSVSDYIKTAGTIADRAITHIIHGDVLTVQWESADISGIENCMRQVLEIEPDNPRWQYIDACLAIAQGRYATGMESIRNIASLYPDFTEAQGFAENPDRWFSPFCYPAWRDNIGELPEHFANLPRGGTLLVSMRDCVDRVVGFFRHCEPGYCVLSKKTTVDIDIKLLDTPFGLIAGAYLIIDPGKRGGRLSETMLSCDKIPPQLQDMSSAGYWLLRLLAGQSYTFILLHDIQTGTVYRKKHYFNAQNKKLLNAIADRLSGISPLQNWDRNEFLKAQQYYMQHVTIDNFLE
ncbi:MAG: hypothetical protein RBU23_00150 [Candidatus Auribacterota bacterium]|jgi:hypothetical protein|nr:hypothetical protein [Candidatus Auribacterota bacterium]